MPVKYVHTNIVANNWKNLAEFYISVFDCKPMAPGRNLKGDWLDKGTGVKNAEIEGMHLLLPGYGENGPTLEVFQYRENMQKPIPAANQVGFSHIAFLVDDVEQTLDKLIQHGGSKKGEIATKKFGNRLLSFIYAADLEGNIVEIQKWEDL